MRIAQVDGRPIIGARLLASALLLACAPIARADDPPPRPTPPRPSGSPARPPSTPGPSVPRPKTPANPAVAGPKRPTPADPGSSTPPPRPELDGPKAEAPEPRRLRVVDGRGRAVVARQYGGADAKVALLPDGQLGWPEELVFTADPFRPETFDEVESALLDGPYRGFRVERREHYLVFYRSSPAFATLSANLLESLYRGLSQDLAKAGIPTQAAEFPLVAVIFRDETEFRAHRRVEPEVQAYYEILSNRIFLFESGDRDRDTPDLAARRKPQTVAHEGTHQVLQNIGVQPRLAEWPLWLVEGLAEYCAPAALRSGGTWAGIRKVNPFHMATLHDLRDTIALQRVAGPAGRRPPNRRIGRDVAAPNLIQSLITSEHLTPTDYALSWALVHYLATRQPENFVSYLRTMGRMEPLAKVTPDDNLKSFTRAFGRDLNRMGKSVDAYLDGLKGYEALPFYAVTFEQPLSNGSLRRATLVSQSPALIHQWVEETRDPTGGPIHWQPTPFPTRTRALMAADQWAQGH